VIDGGSTDGTIDVIDKYRGRIEVFISEPDNGIYDAMNKGAAYASGTHLFFLNSDDFLINKNSISSAMRNIKDPFESLCLGVNIIDRKSSQIFRQYPPREITVWKLKIGLIPPHQGFILSKEWFDKANGFNVNYKISADFDIFLRLYLQKFPVKYLDDFLTNMRSGGESNKSLKSIFFTNNNDIVQSCLGNNVSTNYLLVQIRFFYKIIELISGFACNLKLKK
jgi:glycosyltransferase involved in cell wall biosynthesis